MITVIFDGKRQDAELYGGLAQPDIEGVKIYLDRQGIDDLIHELKGLERGETHQHLMTPTWGGGELDEGPVGDGYQLVNHLRIVRKPE